MDYFLHVARVRNTVHLCKDAKMPDYRSYVYRANSEQVDKLMEEVIVILKPLIEKLVASVKTSAAATSDFLKKWSA